jgi:hypothetical protein
MGEGNENLAYPFPWDYKEVLIHAVKSYDMGPSRFTSHPKGRCAADFNVLKNPSTWPCLNPQSLGPVASTLTTTPPRHATDLGS